MEKNKYKFVKMIVGDRSNDDMLECLTTFDDLMDKGFIEKFTNEKGQIDYQLTHRTGTLEIIQNKKYSDNFSRPVGVD